MGCNQSKSDKKAENVQKQPVANLESTDAVVSLSSPTKPATVSNSVSPTKPISSQDNSENHRSKHFSEERQESVDKENRINLVFRVKRQNLFNHDYDAHSTFTAKSLPKTSLQTEVIRKSF
jgi:hypothetical protein